MWEALGLVERLLEVAPGVVPSLSGRGADSQQLLREPEGPEHDASFVAPVSHDVV